MHLVMARKQPYTLVFAPQVKSHLQTIERKYHSLIRNKINEQLQLEPGVQTTNRKSLRRPVLGADWELRFGPNNRFRVLYDLDEENHQVVILAVGIKEGERLLISGEEVES
jgi:mRNA-degrading endonuclease RelE of RelBE toxin-antitoxin system